MIPNLQIELRRFISSNVISKLNKFYYENDALLIKGIDVAIGTVLMGCYNSTDEKSFKKMVKTLENTSFYKEIDFVPEESYLWMTVIKRKEMCFLKSFSPTKKQELQK